MEVLVVVRLLKGITRIGAVTIAFVVGLLVLLFVLNLLIQLWNGLDAFAQSTGSHGAGWWVVRILLGALGAAILSGIVGFFSNIAVVVLTLPAMGIGWALGFAFGREARPNLIETGGVMVELGKTLTVLFGGLAFYWYCILAPFLPWVPLWSFRIALICLIFIWTPGVALVGFASNVRTTEPEYR